MKALLYKDLQVTLSISKIWMLVMIVYVAIGIWTANTFFLAFSVMIPLLEVMTAMSIDENCHWGDYVLALPVSRKTVALSHYVFGLIATLIVTLIILLFGGIGMLMHRTNPELLYMVPALLLISVCMISVLIPLLIRFGTTKSRLAIMCFTIGIMVATGLASDYMPSALKAPNLLNTMLWLLPVFAILMLIGSIFLSFRIAENKSY